MLLFWAYLLFGIIYLVISIANINMPRDTPGYIVFQKLSHRCTTCRKKGVKTAWLVNKRLCPTCNHWWYMHKWERIYIKAAKNKILVWGIIGSLVISTLYLLLLNYTNIL